MSSHKENGTATAQNSDNKNSETGLKNSNNYRLCHIVKRSDFDGYGFNLHSEKGKPGQYIGKVDEKSPAEQAGLRQGDRIIEVNGVNIGNDTHKQVVQRIKANINEVRLLVIDPECEKKQQQNKKLNNDTTTTTTTTTKTTTATLSLSNNKPSEIDEKDNNLKQNESTDIGKIIEGSTSPTTSTKSQTNSIKSVNNRTDVKVNVETTNGHTLNMDTTDHSNNHHTMTATTTTTTTMKSQEQLSSASMINNNNSTNTSDNVDGNALQMNNNSSNNDIDTVQQSKSSSTTSTTSTTTTTTTTGTGLNLPMTAAEMRAKLMAKKKYDPKNDTVDLRKKFEIIQKL